jgi:hypothetical protein
MAGPGLPHTWRPFGVRLVGVVAGVGLLAVCVAAWIALGEDLRSRFTPFEKLTLVMLGILGAAVWYALLRSPAERDRRRRRGGQRVPRPALRLGADRRAAAAPRCAVGGDGPLRRHHDPGDGDPGSDGDRAKTAVREFRRVLAARTRTDRND